MITLDLKPTRKAVKYYYLGLDEFAELGVTHEMSGHGERIGQLMRVMCFAVLSSFAALLTVLGSYSYGEPAEQRHISFSLPYSCSKGENGECLADSLDAGLNVVLVGKKGNCSAKTVAKFMDENAGNQFEATSLRGAENCDQQDLLIAVIGADPSAVHVVEARNDKSLLSKDIGLKARKIASLGACRETGEV